MMFVVVQSAVYRHDIVGVFSTVEKAVGAAHMAATDERDDHHRFEIIQCDVDKHGETLVCEVVRYDQKHVENGRYVIDSSSFKTEWRDGFGPPQGAPRE